MAAIAARSLGAQTSQDRSFSFEQIETNGVTLRCAVEGDGPLVIMVHGFPELWYSWRHQIRPVAEAGFKDGTPVEFANLLDLACFEKVYMKLSGLNHFAKDEPHYLSARPFTRRIIAEFGPDQLVWGSGVPGIVDAHMPEYSAAQRQQVKGGNLQGLLGFS